ncbi:MAG: polysaccharide biosynthesis tyrosine autokinase [Pirellulaceae bacterium]|nr:polysaccharide biosynthesis tyrosine autokinase [Pirellulaceae bacterium]
MNERKQVLPHNSNSQTHLVHAAMRLLRTIRHRKMNVIVSLLAACLLGGLYYATASRRHAASMSLMLMYQGNEDALPGTDSYRRGMLPTYERLLYSSVVLDRAAEQIALLSPTDQADVYDLPREKWVETLRANLAANAIRSTNFIEVRYLSRDNQAAVSVLNAIVQSYLDFIDDNQRDVATEIVTILDKGRSDVAKQLAAKEQLLLRAKREIGDLGFRDGSTITHPLVHNVVKINEALLEVKKDRMRLEASVIAIQEAIDQGRDLRQFMLSMEDAGGRDLVLSMLGLSAKDEEVVKNLQRELNKDRARLMAIRDFYGSAHPDLVELQTIVGQNEEYLARYSADKARKLDAMQNRNLGAMLLSSAKGKLSTAIAHEKNLESEFSIAQHQAVEVNGRVARVAIIEHDLKMLRELHDTLRNRIANLDIRQDQAEVRVAVVSEPKAKDSPVSPRLLTVCSTVLIGGLGFGIGLAYVLDVLDDRFRSADELRDQLDVSILAIVRQLPMSDATGLESLQVHTAPNAVESESFRTLRSTLAFSDQGGECVAISSSEPGDGKTTVLSNLGVASAQAGKRTLLIDGDMRRPGLTRLFSFRGKGGLSDVLRLSEDVNDLSQRHIQQTSLDGLHILPAGTLPADPSGLLGTSRFSEFVSWACDHYDQVLIDTPPILAASDASIVTRLTNGLVLVVHPSKNHRRLVHRAVDEIRSANLNILGVVINRISSATDTDYGYTYGYGQGYGHGYHDNLTETKDASEPHAPTVRTWTENNRAA